MFLNKQISDGKIRCTICREVVPFPDYPNDCVCYACNRVHPPIGGNVTHGLRQDNFWISNQNDNLMKLQENK